MTVKAVTYDLYEGSPITLQQVCTLKTIFLHETEISMKTVEQINEAKHNFNVK